jgi:hypothetical protein
VREWKKEFDAQLKAMGKLKKADDQDRSLDPFLESGQVKPAGGSPAKYPEMFEDQDEPKEREIDALEQRLEQIMLDTCGYNPDVPTEEELDSMQVEAEDPEAAIDSGFQTESSTVLPSSTPAYRTGLSPDLESMQVNQQSPGSELPQARRGLEILQDLLNTSDSCAKHINPVQDLDEPSSASVVSRKDTKQRGKTAMLIDFSDDEDDEDELIIRNAGE